ncbi:MAG: LptF/LptG family permease [Candidatus Gastranaerophilales bacterium]|nr:LptF/LptG family permease [Candidatus Gastranaerophilales bacterium]
MDLKDKVTKISILDKYIIKQVLEVFIFGVVIFTSIIFASDTFITLIKQISLYGMPFNVALMIILLNLPAVIVMTIPMSVLFATVMTINRLCLASEITIMRACGISIGRITRPIFIFAALMALLTFFINETIVPVTTAQSKTLALWAFGQRNIPHGKKNFTLKELNNGNQIKRLFYVENCGKDEFFNVSILDLSDPKTIQILQAKTGNTSDDGLVFQNASAYTISKAGKTLNTSWMGETVVDFGIDMKEELIRSNDAKDLNLLQLAQKSALKTTNQKDKQKYMLLFWDKTALPVTTIVLVLLGVPLAVTPPRVRYNRGFLFSILIIFFYYLIRALSISFGEAGMITPFLATWAPNIILGTVGYILYHKKVYTIF